MRSIISNGRGITISQPVGYKKGRPIIKFDSGDCQDFKSALSREWLETNGLGGFASSTIASLNTRRYHGLLTAATNPPVKRVVLLSKMEEIIWIDGKKYELSANQYKGGIHPRGFQFLKEFRLDPFPIFTYVVDGIEIEKNVFMVHQENTTVIQYQFRSAGFRNGQIVSPLDRNVVLELRPLIAFRDYHSTTPANGALNEKLQIQEQLITITPYEGLPCLSIAHDAQMVDSNSFWFYNFEYEREKERGLDFKEDLFSPFALKFNVNSRRTICSVVASTVSNDIKEVGIIRHKELHRRKDIMIASPLHEEFLRDLGLAAEQYIVTRKTAEQKTIIAGYHWFADWGRDTMISLPGLAIVRGRFETAKSILMTFVRHADQGMLPNRFLDTGESPEFNTVDAALWFFEAVRSLGAHSNDYEFIKTNLFPVLNDMMDWHIRGTRFGIHMDEDGLLSSGEEGVALTWMDAKNGDWVVTPRRGKPVEIQALWYNALRVMEDFSGRFGDSVRQKYFRDLSLKAKNSFNQKFWNESSGCLYDVIQGDESDGAIRPNQIFSVSLFFPILEGEKAKAVVARVENELLTPYGLRSLSPQDPRYRGRYEGDPLSRDGAYHQGTVWAWLMGPFISAYLKVNQRSPESLRNAQEFLSALLSHCNEAGLGQISEIFDGDFPHTPCGCIAQAWSVAEVLRVCLEDLRGFEDAEKNKASGAGVEEQSFRPMN